MGIKYLVFCLIATSVFPLTGCTQKKDIASGEAKLVWSDEFDYHGLPDSTKWSYATGGDGWGNNEKQFYTEKRMQNANVENGLLTITAIKENFESAAYTSARLVSRGKGDWKYGRMEIRAKLPEGRGIWPAIWMMPTDSKYGSWPVSGEIDIMEFVGYMPDSVYATVHTGAYNHSIGTQKGGRTFRTDLSKEFHVYKLDWNESEIKMFIDDELYFTFVNEKKTSREWPFDQRFHFILNVAVGGNWGGTMGIDESIFPQSMQVDYVRVYQK